MPTLRVTGCHFIVSLDIYYKDILFMFGYTPERAAQLLEQAEGTEELRSHVLTEPVNYKGITFVNPNGSVLILMPIIPVTPEQHGTLVHEIFHAVQGIMQNIGNPLTSDGGNCEPWAHMLGYTVAQAYEKLNQYL